MLIRERILLKAPPAYTIVRFNICVLFKSAFIAALVGIILVRITLVLFNKNAWAVISNSE